MKSTAKNVNEYLLELAPDRKNAMIQLRDTIKKNLPAEFVENINYGMICYAVPHQIYPKGYHCDPKQPLPFIMIASQKNFIAIYHMGIYADKNLYDWFTSEYSKRVKSKLDMGKSCIRFKKIENIPFDLIGELAEKLTAKQWVEIYENAFVKK